MAIYSLNNINEESNNPIDELREAAITVLEYCDMLEEKTRLDKEMKKHGVDTRGSFEEKIKQNPNSLTSMMNYTAAKRIKNIIRDSTGNTGEDPLSKKLPTTERVKTPYGSVPFNHATTPQWNKEVIKDNLKKKGKLKESVAMIYDFLDSIDE